VCERERETERERERESVYVSEREIKREREREREYLATYWRTMIVSQRPSLGACASRKHTQTYT